MIINYDELQCEIDTVKMKKTPKTFLQILDKAYSEVPISKCLAFFLDEKNTNRNVIKHLLMKSTKNEAVDFVDLLEFATFEGVQTEYSISQQSRLDIIIKYSTFWIVIENKINTYESKENQTVDYEKQIKNTNTNNVPIKFIYLKPKFNESKPSNKNFVELLYGDLLDILKPLKEEELNDRENYIYLKDFIKHIEEFLMKDNRSIIDEKALEFYLKNKDKIEYVINTYKQQSLNLRKLIVNSLENKFPTFKVHDTTSYIQIFKENWENRGSTGIHFEILPSTNWDSLLGNKPIKIRFALHNENNTRNKYPDIKHQTIKSCDFIFDNQENIAKSIEKIIIEVESLVNVFEKEIDANINH